jgi:hypothetical protein
VSLRTDMLALKDELTTELVGPQGLDQVTHQLTIRTRTWLGGSIEADVESGPQFIDSDLALPQKYKMRQVTTEDIDGSGGRYEMGDLLVADIIPADPANPGVGYYPTQLAPLIVQGQEVIYIVKGPHNGLYALRGLKTERTYRYDLVLHRRRDQPVVTQPDASGGASE